MSTSRRNTKKTFTKQDKRSFYLVASDVFLGIKFIKTESFSNNTNRNIFTIPSFYFYNNQQKTIIDYSNSKNEEDISYIFSFFSDMTSGVTFEVTNANFIQEFNNTDANLSGIYEFSSIENRKIIKANVISVEKIKSKKDAYPFNFFTNTPQLNKNGSLTTTQQKNNLIKNTLSNGIYSFNRMGIQIGDFIDFSGTTTNQRKKYKVIDFYVDNEGIETIQIDSVIENEDLIGENVILNVYFEGETQQEVNLNEKKYGSCFLDGVCSNCQNQFMCNKRAEIQNAKIVSFIETETCEDALERNNQSLTVNSLIPQPPGITLNDFVNMVEISGVTLNFLITSINSETNKFISQIPAAYIRPKVNYKTANIKVENDYLIDSKKKLNYITIDKGSTLKLILQDFTLLGYDFDLYSDLDNKTVIKNDVNKQGTPGVPNSYITYKTPNSPTTIYLKEKNTIYSIKIDII